MLHPRYLSTRFGSLLLGFGLLLSSGCGGGGSDDPPDENPGPTASLVVDSLTIGGPLTVVSGHSIRVDVNEQAATVADGRWSATLAADPATGELPTNADVVLYADDEAIRQFSIDLSQAAVD